MNIFSCYAHDYLVCVLLPERHMSSKILRYLDRLPTRNVSFPFKMAVIYTETLHKIKEKRMEVDVWQW